MNRRAAWAGQFYPADKASLFKMIEGMVDAAARKVRAAAIVAPHAGYIYSGPVAGAVYSSVEIPETVVILGAPHTDFRARFSVMTHGTWGSPLGPVPINGDLAGFLVRSSALVEEAEEAHEEEHSLEVQVPFLQFFQKRLSLVPVHVNYRSSFPDLEELARAVVRAIKESGREALIVASTDMSHYIDQESAQRLDALAIDRILGIDAKGLFDTVRSQRISMCGYQPTTAALLAAKGLGATRGELVKYQTSGDVSGDFTRVVGYAGLRIY